MSAPFDEFDEFDPDDPGQALLEALAPSGLHGRVGFMLRAATAAIIKDLAQAFKPFGLRGSHYACLLVVRAEPGLKQQRVGEILAVKRSNLVATIDHLENRGYLVRTRPIDNRRINTLHITEAGAALLKQMDEAEAAHRGRLVATLGEDDLAHLLDSLARLAQMAPAATAEPEPDAA